ncbi:hypothetical protein PRIPAC_77325 [Pristionchus pacificus]|uniref:Uncharacterized protein n=1 Tax=Pristionchus pacificus TaxID=54126 RepID=A0A454XPI1_PRIPA|nr:hypothetical protein PRIPAC_77325 [Pristionchus pacificus]|eukprot:PDM72358.1 hypothetical protein PRIPAC_38792 [Pristionchus pacificus]
MADKLTPEMIEKIKKARVYLKENPAVLDDSIAKLSVDAQGPAKKMRDLFLSDSVDAAKMKAAGDQIRANCSPAVVKELEDHRKIMSEKLGAFL